MINDIKKRIGIDLYSPTSYEVLNAQQGDNLSRIIEFVLYDQGNLYKIPDNIKAKLEGHRGDNSSFIKENCSISENSISVTLDSDILYADGIVEAKIVMQDLSSDKVLSTIPFKIHVQKDPCNKMEIEKEKYSLIDWLVSNFKKIQEIFESHIYDKVAHLSKLEHDRFDKLQNEIFVSYNENVPDHMQTGDYYLQEYR